MPAVTDFNDDWMFDGRETLRLPHSAVDLPYSYFDETAYQRVFTYEKTFAADPAWAGQEVSVRFDGAMANAKVSLNGTDLVGHADGYTPFTARLTGGLRPGLNTLRVVIDGSENPAIPPFGGAIDYLTYAGLYRDVWLVLSAPVSIGPTKVETPDVLAEVKSVTVVVALNNPQGLALSGTLTARLLDGAGKELALAKAAVSGETVTLRMADLHNIALWDIAAPNLYRIDLTLDAPQGRDTTTTTFGFRAAEFTADGFFLNGRPLKIRGLNRHQSFPYSGYALGRAAQERDAEILKNELHLNLVRTSHYPQSSYFLDHCDRIGLLVFEEIPGWQHIGPAEWKAEAVENVRRMITRDWNHPSIIIWGVRINESQDDHDFYTETNRVARELDATRQTGGVRYISESEMLEDVYTMNDFILGDFENGGNRPRTALRRQQEVTGLKRNVPYLVTEFNGHMYPTKSFDQEQRQAEHVTRHLDVLNAAYGDPNVSGCIGWCAFDYNTHKDFGSGRPHLPPRCDGHVPRAEIRRLRLCQPMRARRGRGDGAGHLLGARRAQHRRRVALDHPDQLRRGRTAIRRQPRQTGAARPRALFPSAACARHRDQRRFLGRRVGSLGDEVGSRAHHRLSERQGRCDTPLCQQPLAHDLASRARCHGHRRARCGAGHGAGAGSGGQQAALPVRSGHDHRCGRGPPTGSANRAAARGLHRVLGAGGRAGRHHDHRFTGTSGQHDCPAFGKLKGPTR